MPLHAVVLLRKGEDGIALERVPAADTLRDLWLLSFRLPTLEDRERCFGIARLAATVRISNLVRPLRLDELPRVIERIVADA